MKKLLLALSFSLVLCGCSAIQNVGHYVNNNPVAVNIATRQAVYRYVDSGDTEEKRAERAAEVIWAAKTFDTFVQGNPKASVAQAVNFLRSKIDWDKLSGSDRLLAEDILLVLEDYLAKQVKKGTIDDDALVGINTLLNVVLRTAELAL